MRLAVRADMTIPGNLTPEAITILVGAIKTHERLRDLNIANVQELITYANALTEALATKQGMAKLISPLRLSERDQDLVFGSDVPDELATAIAMAPWGQPAAVVRWANRFPGHFCDVYAAVNRHQLNDDQTRTLLSSGAGRTTDYAYLRAGALRGRSSLWDWAVRHDPAAASLLGVDRRRAEELTAIAERAEENTARAIRRGLLLRPETPAAIRARIAGGPYPTRTSDREHGMSVRTTTEIWDLGWVQVEAITPANELYPVIADLLDNPNLDKTTRADLTTVAASILERALHGTRMPAPTAHGPEQRGPGERSEFANPQARVPLGDDTFPTLPLGELKRRWPTYHLGQRIGELLHNEFGDDADGWDYVIGLLDLDGLTLNEVIDTVNAST